MRILSDNVATKDQMTVIDKKQTREIIELKIIIVVSFFTNFIFTGVLYYFG